MHFIDDLLVVYQYSKPLDMPCRITVGNIILTIDLSYCNKSLLKIEKKKSPKIRESSDFNKICCDYLLLSNEFYNAYVILSKSKQIFFRSLKFTPMDVASFNRQGYMIWYIRFIRLIKWRKSWGVNGKTINRKLLEENTHQMWILNLRKRFKIF